ncbi:MAG: leucine--tRNA ligase [Candidatus Binatia bacterium]|nr:MAG: leucine--tRNA ligase [Candidatus Binatia bacterium]
MGARRRGRELALQLLYQLDVTPSSDFPLESLVRHFGGGESARAFALELVRGVLEHREEIDRLVAETTRHWKLDRLSKVDRNILRLAVYELLHTPEVPVQVVIDEAIEIARTYGDRESPAFVNGVLDAIAHRRAAARVETSPTEDEKRAMTDRYRPDEIEAKWQRLWEERGTNRIDVASAERPYYALMMFPYPSAEGLHVGHAFAFPGVDIHGRFKRLQGYDVFEPIGFDAFGIHSENYALRVGRNPKELIPATIANFRRQLKRLGLMIPWEYEIDTTSPRYYRWTQWIFLQLYRHGLAVRKKAPVNWCPECKTVLANEQVVDGRCERHPETQVEQRVTEQWFFRITAYAQRLLDNLRWIDWSETTKRAQENWIGRSEGAEIDFPLAHDPTRSIRVFTTRPDTLFGVTYMVLAPEHSLVEEITTPDRKEAVRSYLERVRRMDLVTRRSVREKTGVFTGAYAIHPATEEPVPIWVADYVLAEYGTGAVMAVPAHDQRDFEFAREFSLPIVEVIRPADAKDRPCAVREAYVSDSDRDVLVHSGPFTGKPVPEGKKAIVEWLERTGRGKAAVQYRLHDWCISRQRYWGPPIPIVYCEECGIVPVPEKDLPVLLPDIEDFRPDASGLAPLARVPSFVHTNCPACGKAARRETDVSDTFLDSAWYFLRYPSAHRDDVAFDPELTRKWLPVDAYIGGNEHAVLHLLYARFLTMALHDIGLLPFEEPFKKFRAHGLIIKDGAKMSKSRGNVVNPDQYIQQYGADVFRLSMMFLGPYEEGGDFRDEGIAGVRRFVESVWRIVTGLDPEARASAELRRATHRAIQKVTEDTEALRYNTAIAAMMTLVNEIRRHGPADRWVAETLVLLLAPYAPHVAEELWERLGHTESVFDARWPEYDPRELVEETVEIAVQVNGKVRGRVQVRAEATEEEILAAALGQPSVQAHIAGKPLRRKVVVPGKLVNLVV